MNTRLLHGDCLEKLKELESNSIDSIVTDPPYELGFMGKAWDKTGIANSVEMWRECLRVLKPGGHLLAFSGTRTYHRMASAIEDAGFEVRDMIEWVYGSGFPKSLNIGKAVDEKRGNERELVETYRTGEGANFKHSGNGTPQHHLATAKDVKVTKGTSEWEGWGTALKPAHEPICMARKPLGEKTVAENCLKWRTGGINIDESRIPTDENRNRQQKDGPLPSKYGFNSNSMGNKFVELNPIGRFPANLIHDNSEEVRECFPEAKGMSGGGKHKATYSKEGVIAGGGHDGNDSHIRRDSGNASRFFKSIIYQSKASRKDRGEGNNHATVKPTKLMEYLINIVTREGQTVLDPFMGSGTTGVACKQLNRNFIGIELEADYLKIAQERIGL